VTKLVSAAKWSCGSLAVDGFPVTGVTEAPGQRPLHPQQHGTKTCACLVGNHSDRCHGDSPAFIVRNRYSVGRHYLVP